jgi:hypothetical protein
MLGTAVRRESVALAMGLMLKSMMSVQLELENMHTQVQRQRLMYGEGLGGGGIVARTMNTDCIDRCDSPMYV